MANLHTPKLTAATVKSAKATIRLIAIPIGIDRHPPIGSPSNPPGIVRARSVRSCMWTRYGRPRGANPPGGYQLPDSGIRRPWRIVACLGASSGNEPNRSVRTIPEPRRRIVSEPEGFREAPGSGTWRVASRERAGSAGRRYGAAGTIVRVPGRIVHPFTGRLGVTANCLPNFGDSQSNPIRENRRIRKPGIRRLREIRLRG